VRPGRGHQLRLFHLLAQISQVLLAQRGLDPGEEVLLLLLDVVAHVLDQDVDLGPEPLVGRLHPLQLGADPLDDVVLLERLQHLPGAVGRRLPGRRVEEGFFDGSVHGERGNHGIDQLGLRHVGPRTRLFELAEEGLDLAMIIHEQVDGIHATVVSTSDPGKPKGGLASAGWPRQGSGRLILNRRRAISGGSPLADGG
jgi:hypothetical protein